jgi:transcription-repair coupling factor (superfamily II helicase)
MTDDARKRINALVQFSELGSGFNIAMKDLEIRGAGDLLGGEQSGFINEIGFDTYQKIMNEAIDELKENEFANLYQEENDIETKEFVKEFQIDTDFELLFPDEYINNISERLSLYNELGSVKNNSELEAYEKRLIDRFGPLPKEAGSLLNSVRIKWKAKQIGLERLILKQNKMIGYFIGEQQSNFYQSNRFMNVMKLSVRLNLRSTIYFNFKVLPFHQAVKLPFHFFGKTDFADLSNTVFFRKNAVNPVIQLKRTLKVI